MAIKGRVCCLSVLIDKKYAQVAQLVEQWTENPRVGGSDPLGTPFTKEYHMLSHFN